MKDESKIIDCFGDICPVPILKMDTELERMKSGEKFMLVTDHSCTIEAIKEKSRGLNAELEIIEVMNGVWEVYVTKK